MWIIDINGDKSITYQGALDELQQHQTPRWKSKVNISLCKRKRYHITDLEEICSIFDQVGPVVSHPEVHIPVKSLFPNKIGEYLKVTQRQLWKEYLFLKYEKNKNVSLLYPPIPIKYLPEGTNPSIHSFIKVLIKLNVLMYGNVLHATAKMGVIRFKVLILISPTFQWHMITRSEATLLLRICINSLLEF